MAGKIRALLISNAPERNGLENFENAIKSLGSLEIADESDSMRMIMENKYELIVSITNTEHLPAQVAEVRARQPGSAIIVVSPSPSWMEARAAFQAGATDYISKWSTESETRTVLQEALIVTNNADD